MNKFNKHIIRLKIKWLNEDLKTNHNYAKRNEIINWIAELKTQLNICYIK